MGSSRLYLRLSIELWDGALEPVLGRNLSCIQHRKTLDGARPDWPLKRGDLYASASLSLCPTVRMSLSPNSMHLSPVILYGEGVQEHCIPRNPSSRSALVSSSPEVPEGPPALPPVKPRTAALRLDRGERVSNKELRGEA